MNLSTNISFITNITPTLIEDESVSVVMSNRLPEHFKEDFPTFKQFIAQYFSFLRKNQTSYDRIESIKDIDDAGRIYLEAMYSVYGKGLPEFEYMGMADFIRNSREFFSSKGSEDSYKFFFKIMFGVDIDIKYPKENILVPSSGKWDQKTSVFADLSTSTGIDTLIGKKLFVNDSSGSTSTIRVLEVTNRSGTIYEIVFTALSTAALVIGAKITDPANAQFSGVIVPSLNQYEILSSGEGFNLGTVYEITTPYGVTSFRITKTNNDRGIEKIEFFSFANTSSSSYTFALDSASIKLVPGSINKYTGFYSDTQGFLSDNNKLQDNFFYQLFSYVIKSSVSRELYQEVVEKILHPAGMKMFSENNKDSEYSIVIDYLSTENSSTKMFDYIQVYDNLTPQYQANRLFSEILLLSDTFSRQWSTTRGYTDTLSISDSLSKGIGKGIVETITISEGQSFTIIKSLSDSTTITDIQSTG